MESPRQVAGARMADRLRRERYSSQMRSSHHAKGLLGCGVWKGEERNLPRSRAAQAAEISNDHGASALGRVSRQQGVQQGENMPNRKACMKYYLHPALLNRRAYILPMSPMPIRPTTKSSGDGAAAIVDAIVARPARAADRTAADFKASSSFPCSHRRACDFPRL